MRAFTGKSVITIINITFNINIIFRLHTPTTRPTIQIVVFSGSVNSILLTSWEKSRQVSKIIKKLISLKQHICIFVNIIANMTMCLSVCSCVKYILFFSFLKNLSVFQSLNFKVLFGSFSYFLVLTWFPVYLPLSLSMSSSSDMQTLTYKTSAEATGTGRTTF